MCLLSCAANCEVFVLDLKGPRKPYSPGTRSTKLDEITALALKYRLPYVLAVSSSTGSVAYIHTAAAAMAIGPLAAIYAVLL